MSLAIPLVTQRKHWSDWLGFLGLTLALLVLLTFLAAPLLAILQQAAQDDQGQYVGLRNFAAYLQTPALLYSLWNSVWVSALVTLIVVPLAFFSVLPAEFTAWNTALLILAPVTLPAADA